MFACADIDKCVTTFNSIQFQFKMRLMAGQTKVKHHKTAKLHHVVM